MSRFYGSLCTMQVLLMTIRISSRRVAIASEHSYVPVTAVLDEQRKVVEVLATGVCWIQAGQLTVNH